MQCSYYLMFSTFRFGKYFLSTPSLSKPFYSRFFHFSRKIILPLAVGGASFYCWKKLHQPILPNEEDELIKQFQIRRQALQLQTITSSSTHSKFILTLWSILSHTLRFFQLLFIFSPVILLYPFRDTQLLRNLWLDIFVKSVEMAGVVWIKSFQYLTHRRDILGEQMADKFTHLRQNAPQHSFEETKKSFFKLYGKKIQEVFEQFEEIPIASGSVSQVYKAVYKGNKVALKARHPGVEKYIQRDINILFFFSRFLSLFSKSFRFPISQQSMKKTLIDQINFNNQKDNLLIFNQLFKDSHNVKFPKPFPENTNEAFLIETFVGGLPITYYEKNKHKLQQVIAQYGTTIFFKMFMIHNFIHADCHGGNMLIQIVEKNSSFFGEIWEYIKEKVQQAESYFIMNSLSSQKLKMLFMENRKQEKRIRDILKKCQERVVVNLIDVGMVIRLQESDRIKFINFIKSVLQGEGQKCAQMIFGMSLFNGLKIQEGTYQIYRQQLKQLFSQINKTSLQDLQGVKLLTGMLDVIRNNDMKLQGEFATLLTNMLVLEATAKQLDPKINILKCVIPYFKYVDKEMEVNRFNDKLFL